MLLNLCRSPRSNRIQTLLEASSRDGAGLLLCLGTLALSACVSQQRYDEAVQMARLYQDSTHDLEAYVSQLEAERDRWAAPMTQDANLQIEPAPDLPVDAELQSRMQELQDIASRLGTPGDVESVRVEGGYGFSLKDSVLFDSGSDQIKVEGRALLLQLAADISAKPYQTVWVRGHTDSDPVSRPETLQRFPGGNLELSAARAVEVARLLVREGRLLSGKVNVAGLGPNRPLADNSSSDGKRKNRRVEIFVLEIDPEIQSAGAPAGR